MRIMIVDPGRQICGVLFFAVPPPGQGDHLYVIDELYIRNCDAEKFAAAVAEKAGGKWFYVFIIDGHAGRVAEMGSGKTVQQQYAEALEKRRVESELTGSNFIWGADDPKAGILKVRDLLRIREDGTTKLKVLKNRCPALVDWEFPRYHYKRLRGGLIAEDPEKKNDHLMDCLRYGAMYEPTYHKPKDPKKRKGHAVLALEAKRKRKREKHGRQGVHLGPGKGGWR
jgi:hypothetical protein